MVNPPALIAIAASALLCVSASAHAAHISIDDSHPDTITLTAVDFEGGLVVDGAPYLGGPLVLADDAHTISGIWIDLGDNLLGAVVQVLYALPGQPDGVTSGITFGVTTDGNAATLTGDFGGFTGAPYFFTVGPTIDQTSGLTAAGSAAFLTVEFTPERAFVPEPSLIGLVVLGCGGAGVWRRARLARRVR